MGDKKPDSEIRNPLYKDMQEERQIIWRQILKRLLMPLTP
jgi:hypothetical protein